MNQWRKSVVKVPVYKAVESGSITGSVEYFPSNLIIKTYLPI